MDRGTVWPAVVPACKANSFSSVRISCTCVASLMGPSGRMRTARNFPRARWWSGTSPKWWPTESTRSGPTRRHRSGCWTRRNGTDCGSWRDCRWSVRWPFWITGNAPVRLKRWCASRSAPEPAIRPLVMAEMGLDSYRNGETVQAQTLGWQLRTAFASGCAGLFVYAWTDEWFRGGAEVEDWKFGLTDRNRQPKPALASVRKAFGEVPFARDLPWPRVSVVICSYNGARIIRDCLEGLQRLAYPTYEVIVVDDGST